MNWLPKRWPTEQSAGDEDAMRLVQLHADPTAFTALVRRWETPIRRLCTRMCGDEHRGEDLAQDAFARVFTHRHQFQAGRKFSTWLWRIAINLCHEEARRARAGETADPIEVVQHVMPDQQLMQNEECDRVRMALAALPEAQRIVVILREYEGLKFRQIAEVLNTPEGTVKSRMADAMTELSRTLNPTHKTEDRNRPRRAAIIKERL